MGYQGGLILLMECSNLSTVVFGCLSFPPSFSGFTHFLRKHWRSKCSKSKSKQRPRSAHLRRASQKTAKKIFFIAVCMYCTVPVRWRGYSRVRSISRVCGETRPVLQRILLQLLLFRNICLREVTAQCPNRYTVCILERGRRHKVLFEIHS